MSWDFYIQFILSVNCSTCFGRFLHPSSVAQITLSTASGTTAIYRGGVDTAVSTPPKYRQLAVLPDAADRVICATDEGWRNHPKHVEQFTDKINCVQLHLVGHLLTQNNVKLHRSVAFIIGSYATKHSYCLYSRYHSFLLSLQKQDNLQVTKSSSPKLVSAINIQNTKIIVCCNVLPCSPIERYRRRRWSCCFCLSLIYDDVVSSRLFWNISIQRSEVTNPAYGDGKFRWIAGTCLPNSTTSCSSWHNFGVTAVENRISCAILLVPSEWDGAIWKLNIWKGA